MKRNINYFVTDGEKQSPLSLEIFFSFSILYSGITLYKNSPVNEKDNYDSSINVHSCSQKFSSPYRMKRLKNIYKLFIRILLAMKEKSSSHFKMSKEASQISHSFPIKAFTFLLWSYFKDIHHKCQ